MEKIFKSLMSAIFVSGTLFNFMPIPQSDIFERQFIPFKESIVAKGLMENADTISVKPMVNVAQQEKQPKVTTQSQVTKIQKTAAPTKQQDQPQVKVVTRVETKPKVQTKAVQQQAQPKQQVKTAPKVETKQQVATAPKVETKPKAQAKAVQQQAQPKQQSKPPVTTKQVSQAAPPAQKFKNDTDMSDAEYEAYLKKHGVDMSEPESVHAIIGVNAERGQTLFSD